MNADSPKVGHEPHVAPAANIDDKLAAFEAGAVDPAKFPHREHLRIGFEMLRRYSFIEAARKIRAGLQSLAQQAGRPEVYHETKTLAWLAIVSERMARQENQTWDSFAGANRDLLRKDLLERWYGRRQPAVARTTFILPPPSRWEWVTVTFAAFIASSSAITFWMSLGQKRGVTALAGIELLAALALPIRRFRRLAVGILLAVFVVAAIACVHAGEWPGRFIYFGITAFLIARWS